MKRIDIKISFSCNNHCRFCVRQNGENSCPNMSADTIRSILNDSKNSYGEVVLTGGEPTLRRDFIQIVSFAKDLGYKVHIQTNGRMFAYKDFCKETIKAGADIFAISLHGHSPRVHDYLTGIDGSFMQTSQGITNLLSFGTVVLTNTVITKTNFRFLPNIAKLLKYLGILQYQFAFPHILGRALLNRDTIVPRKREVMPYVVKGLKIGLNARMVSLTEAFPYCILGEYRDCAAEKNIPDTKVFDSERIVGNLNRLRKGEGKAKGPKCKICRYFESCEGPWREYPYFYGWDEFIPVK